MQTIKKIIEPTNQPSSIASLKKGWNYYHRCGSTLCISMEEIYISVGIKLLSYFVEFELVKINK
jgi:hypothetical protein